MPAYRYDPSDTSRFAGSIGELIARRGDIAAQRAIQVAQAQAQAQQARGQAWGGAMQNIAGSVGDAIAGYAKQREEAPLRAQQLEAGRIRNEAGRMEIASAKQAAEDKAILGSAQGSGLDPASVKAQLQQRGRGDLIPIYEQTHANLETARLGLQAKRTEVQGLESDYFGALAAGVKKAKYDPMAIEWALAQADADGHDTKPVRAMLQQKPDALPQIIDALIEKSPTQRKLSGEEADRALKTQQEQRAIKTAEQQEADRIADNRRQADTAAETARHNRAIEASGAGAAERSGYFTMTPVYDAQGRPVGAVRLNARTGEITTVQPGEMGGVTARPPGTLGQQTIANEASLDSLARLKEMFDQGAKNDIGPAEGRARSLGQKVPGGMLVTERFANFEAATRAFQNAMIKAITGAQMSEPEAKRIMGQIPNTNDNPTVWQAKYTQSVKNMEDLERRTRTDRGVQSAPAGRGPGPVGGASGQIVVTAPDGSKHPFASQAEADAFKKLAGIK